MKEEDSYTGKYLKIHLDREEERKKKIKTKIHVMDKRFLAMGKVGLERHQQILQLLMMSSHQQRHQNQQQKILSEVQVQYHEKTLLVGIRIQCHLVVTMMEKVI